MNSVAEKLRLLDDLAELKEKEYIFKIRLLEINGQLSQLPKKSKARYIDKTQDPKYQRAQLVAQKCQTEIDLMKTKREIVLLKEKKHEF